MTAKRFKYVEFTRNILSFDDNGVCKFFNEQEFEDWLNELNEENKKLKQVNEMLQMDFAMTERNLIEENEQLKHQLSQQEMEYVTDCHRLAEENMQLQEELDYYKTKCGSLETALVQGRRAVDKEKEQRMFFVDMEKQRKMFR